MLCSSLTQSALAQHVQFFPRIQGLVVVVAQKQGLGQRLVYAKHGTAVGHQGAVNGKGVAAAYRTGVGPWQGGYAYPAHSAWHRGQCRALQAGAKGVGAGGFGLVASRLCWGAQCAKTPVGGLLKAGKQAVLNER
jgi:hypothetical protein